MSLSTKTKIYGDGGFILEMYDVVEPCSDSGAYRAEPSQETRIDLEKMEEYLVEKDFEIGFSSEVILLVQHPDFDIEVGIYPSGKLLFKTADEEKVDELFEEFTTLVENFKEKLA
ncbi:MAG: hypothetical protein V5A66_00620 [Candidatus Thermoplasmatota archaeon]